MMNQWIKYDGNNNDLEYCKSYIVRCTDGAVRIAQYDRDAGIWWVAFDHPDSVYYMEIDVNYYMNIPEPPEESES